MFSNPLVCDILLYLNENITCEITSDELSRFFYFDKTYIMKKFKKEIGISIHTYINHIRIYNSLPLFKQEYMVLKIALYNRFQSLEYFSETFKKIIGVSPTVYRAFIENASIVSEEEYKTICNSLISLKDLKDFTDTYLKNRKPEKPPVKKIFFKV